MSIKGFLHRIVRGGGHPEKEAMKYCFDHGFKAGKNFQYNSGYPIDSNWPWLISVGDNVTLATGVKILAHDASTAKAGVHTKIGIVEIGDNVFIGANSIVLCNTRIGNNVIVGAGTVISKDIPDNVVVVRGFNSEYRVLCTFDEYIAKQRKRMEELPVSDILFADRTDEQWEQWKLELNKATGGFDL